MNPALTPFARDVSREIRGLTFIRVQQYNVDMALECRAQDAGLAMNRLSEIFTNLRPMRWQAAILYMLEHILNDRAKLLRLRFNGPRHQFQPTFIIGESNLSAFSPKSKP